MSHSQLPDISNRLLLDLANRDLEALLPCLETVTLTAGDILEEPGHPGNFAYFLQSGIASAAAIATDRRSIEVATVSRDGMIGISTLLGDDHIRLRISMLVPGFALRIARDAFRKAVAQSSTLQSSLLQYSQAFMIQTAHTALAIGHFSLKQRVASWILNHDDNLEGEPLRITHEALAKLLAARRSGVTEVIAAFGTQGLILQSRGILRIHDRAGIEAAAGQSYKKAPK